MAKKIVFLDRDGTIIEDKIYLNDPEQIHYLDDVFEALQLLHKNGYEFVIVTNQSGIPRGLVQEENLHKIHQIIADDYKKHDVPILGFYYAPHLPDSDHPLRKPDTGMLKAAEADHGPFDYESSWMIGDRMTDVECGHRMGCKSIFLTITEDPKESKFAAAEYETDNLLDAAKFILNS
ncbi:MAG: HAD family hydrolase [Bdellovibrionota bacterium]|nr:HAD family hydrolase [Pseudobdellovibrionaceae bacterium]|tara:strand:+ start:10990 stop:11523 length:534 start_codon:yes stop_codon:yes gene_type:complete